MQGWLYKSNWLLKKLVLVIITLNVVLNISTAPLLGNAQADDLAFELMVTSENSAALPNSLFIVNPNNGVQGLLGEQFMTPNINALDRDPISGRLFGIESGRIAEIDQSNGQLISDVTTFNGGVAQYIEALAFSPNGALYGWSWRSAFGIIDLNNATFTPVYSTPDEVYHVGMDFAPNGLLYAVYVSQSGNIGIQKLVSINLVTSTVVSENSISYYAVDDMDFAPDGFIYATNFSSALIKINPIDGQATIADFFNLTSARGIASSNTIHITPAPPVPNGLSISSGNGQVILNWNPVPEASYYNIYYSNSPDVSKATKTKVTNATNPYIVNYLTNGIPYYFVVTAGNIYGESAESDQVSAVPNMPSAYSTNDLVGNWASNSLATSPGAPWWERGSIAVLKDGSFTGTATNSASQTNNLSGTFSITSDGIITRQGNSILKCALDSGRTLFACTDTWGAYPDPNDDYTKEMKVFVKKGGSYAQDDLTGTWEMNQLGTPGPHWARGRNINITANGSFSGSLEGHDFASRGISGTAVMANTGKITVSIPSESSTAQCDMDLDKTVFVCTETRNSETMLSIFVRKAASYSQSDLPGLWNINNLISPMAWWGRVFPMTVLANRNYSGHLIGSESDTEDLSGTFNINGDGIVTSASAPFSFVMDAGKSIMSGVGTGSEGDSNLLIIAKQAQPTTKTLSSLAVTSGPSSVNEGTGGTYGATAYWSDGTSSAVTTVWSVTPGTYASVNPSTGLLATLPVPSDQVIRVTATFSSGGVTLTADRKVTIVDLQDTLNVSITGTGAGSVYSVPSGSISCHYPPLSGTCSSVQNHGASIELTASPDGGDAVFNGWSGACTNSVGNCTVTLDADKTVTATFSPAPLAMIGTNPYDSIQAAYGAAALSGTIIMLKEGDHSSALGSLNANDNKSVTIQGGYNAAYNARSGNSMILGPVTMGLGSLILDSVGIR